MFLRIRVALAAVALIAAACAAPKSVDSPNACVGEPVAAVPPDTVPAWFRHDTSYGGGYLKHIVVVRFDSTATTSERQRAVESVCGRVVGGWHLAGPGEDLYAVQLADGGDRRRMVELVEKIRAQPGVAAAMENPALRVTPH